MTDASLYDEVHDSIAQEISWIELRLDVIKEVLDGMENTQRPLKVADLRRMFKGTLERFEEKRLVIVVSGLTSSGKSSLINALLGFNLLFTAPDHSTPCLVSVERSPDPQKAFFKDDRSSEDIERDIRDLRSVTDSKSETPSQRPLFAFLSTEQAKNGILRVGDELRLVDSPGIHESSFKNCDLDADAFTFVVDLTCGTKWEDLKEIMQANGLRSKPVIIVFSKCDVIHRYDERRFNIERENRMKEARNFLETNGKESEAAIFFLAPPAAVTKRNHDAEIQALGAAILEASEDRPEDRTALLIGAGRSGKTALCADLIKSDIPSYGGQKTPCSVVYTAGETSKVSYEQLSQEEESVPYIDDNPLLPAGSASSETENVNQIKTFVSLKNNVSLAEDLKNIVDAATGNNPSNEIRVRIAEEALSAESLLTKGFTIIDTPPLEDFEGLPTSTKLSVVIVAITSEGRPNEHRNRIKKCLRMAGANVDTKIFLAVTKWKEFRDQQTSSEAVEEWKRSIEKVFRNCCQELQQSPKEARRVFYIESESLMELYDASFTEFEKRLIKAGHDEFATFKLKAIKDSVTQLLQEMQNRIDSKLQVLEKTKYFFQEFTSSISEKFLTDTDEAVNLRRQTRASRFLKPSLQLPDTESDMKEFLSSFLTYYREDVTTEIRQLSSNVLERFNDMDEGARKNAQNFHDEQIKAIATQLGLKNNKGDDFYGLSNMLETFMKLMPGPVDEESLFKIRKLKDMGRKLYNLLNALKMEEQWKAREVEQLQEKAEKLEMLSNDPDQALAEHLAQSLEVLSSMMLRIEEHKKRAVEKQRKAEKTYEEAEKKIRGIEEAIKEMTETLLQIQCRLVKQQNDIFMRFLNFLSRNYFSHQLEAASSAKEKEIEGSLLEAVQMKEEARDANTTAFESKDEAFQYQSELINLSQRKEKMEEDLKKIVQRVNKAKEKMEEEKRNIMIRHESSSEELKQQRSRIQKTKKDFLRNQENIRSTEIAFLEQKNRWDVMKREYYRKLLSELETMSNMLLRKILHDLHQRTRQFASAEQERLAKERNPISNLRKKLSDL